MATNKLRSNSGTSHAHVRGFGVDQIELFGAQLSALSCLLIGVVLVRSVAA